MEEDRSVFYLKGHLGNSATRYGEDPDQIIEIFDAASNFKGNIALVHGGYWRPEYDRAHLRPLAKALAEEGWQVHLIEYRRIPGNPDAAVSDINSALHLIPEAVIIGHSAGGHLGLITSKNENVQALIALAPVADLVAGDGAELDEGAIRDFLGEPAAQRLDLNPQSNPTYVPTILIHGSEDIRVPVEMSRVFIAAHPGTSYIELEGTGHFELIDPRTDAWEVLKTELKKFE